MIKWASIFCLLGLLSAEQFTVFAQTGFSRGIRSNQNGNAACNGRWNDADCWCVLSDAANPASTCSSTTLPAAGDIIYIRVNDVITVFQQTFTYTGDKMGIVLLGANDGAGGNAGAILQFDPNSAAINMPDGSGLYIYNTPALGNNDDAIIRCNNTGGGSCNAVPQSFVSVDGVDIWGGDTGSNAPMSGGGNIGGGVSPIDPVTPLPVTLVSFHAVKAQGAIQLAWHTATEINNDYFEVERSADGRTFEVIGRVAGSGNSSTSKYYSLTDSRPLKGVSYYRLRQVDYDGAYEYSKVIATSNRAAQSAQIFVYPNPTRGGSLKIHLSGVREGSVVVAEYFNAQGALVHREQATISAETTEVTTADGLQLAPGMYILRVRAGEQVAAQRLVIE